jgi:hypothetical protein
MRQNDSASSIRHKGQPVSAQTRRSRKVRSQRESNRAQAVRWLDRLIKTLRLQGITTFAAANA